MGDEEGVGLCLSAWIGSLADDEWLDGGEGRGGGGCEEGVVGSAGWDVLTTFLFVRQRRLFNPGVGLYFIQSTA